MILARLTRAIRRQNWFAVALEFVIVILGVVWSAPRFLLQLDTRKRGELV